MNLLVTGGAGFIGSNLIRHIIERPEVDMLVNLDCLTYAGHLESLDEVARHRKYGFAKVDLRDGSVVHQIVHDCRITHVAHLAAESHVDRSIDGPADFIHTNILGTFHLLEACRSAWLPAGQYDSSSPSTGLSHRFHHVSTDEVYGSLGPCGYFTETSPYAPNSPYSASKASSDMLVRAYHHTYGLPAVITNCSNNYGPYQFPEKLIPKTILRILDRHAIPVYGNGMNVRDWLYVGDHVDALWQVLIRGRDGETYNIGGGTECTNIELVGMICDLVDEFMPALGGNSRSLISFVGDRPGHDFRYAIDASRIRGELGWSPAHTFARGIQRTVRWYLEHQEWIRAVTSKP